MSPNAAEVDREEPLSVEDVLKYEVTLARQGINLLLDQARGNVAILKECSPDAVVLIGFSFDEDERGKQCANPIFRAGDEYWTVGGTDFLCCTRVEPKKEKEGSFIRVNWGGGNRDYPTCRHWTFHQTSPRVVLYNESQSNIVMTGCIMGTPSLMAENFLDVNKNPTVAQQLKHQLWIFQGLRAGLRRASDPFYPHKQSSPEDQVPKEN